MAYLRIFASSKHIAKKLMKRIWKMDVRIRDQKTFDELTDLGFDKEKWEEKNKGNKVTVESDENNSNNL